MSLGRGINFIPMESNSLGEVFPFIGKRNLKLKRKKLRIFLFGNLEEDLNEKKLERRTLIFRKFVYKNRNFGKRSSMILIDGWIIIARE